MKDHPDQKLTFDQQNQVNTYVKATVDQQMAVANDPSKTPAEQLAAAQSADKTLTDASQAAADSGNNDLAESFAQKYGDAKVGEKLTELKIKTGDPGATEKAIGDAGNDPAKLRAVANALPDSDPRKEALGLIADGKVTGDSARKLLDAMNDQDHTFGELADAIGKSDGNPDVLKAVADVAQYKAKQNADQGNGDTAATMQNLADTMTAISKASDGVRKELSKGFDDSGNFGDFQRAFDSAGSKADVDALKAFVGYTSAQEKAGDRNPSFSHGEADKLQTISDNFDALHANPETWKKVQWAVRDNNDTSRDLRDAAKNTNDPKALEALQTLAKQSGDNDLAVRLEVVRTQYKDLSADAKEKFLKDGHF
ncbi:MAG: hypothetical protein JWM80_1506 [Cyanobacteria bacterium RYN_339]|nr:hypothetical protein [Cyanobacteria bacterium RYN_339]